MKGELAARLMAELCVALLILWFIVNFAGEVNTLAPAPALTALSTLALAITLAIAVIPICWDLYHIREELVLIRRLLESLERGEN